MSLLLGRTSEERIRLASTASDYLYAGHRASAARSIGSAQRKSEWEREKKYIQNFRMCSLSCVRVRHRRERMFSLSLCLPPSYTPSPLSIYSLSVYTRWCSFFFFVFLVFRLVVVPTPVYARGAHHLSSREFRHFFKNGKTGLPAVIIWGRVRPRIGHSMGDTFVYGTYTNIQWTIDWR